MIAWQDTVKTALLGTKRAEMPTQADEQPLGQFLAQLPMEEEAATLLAAAGTTALHRQTGWQPRQAAPPAPAPSPPDMPVCPPVVARQIEQMLLGPQTSLLPEMLDALAQTGHRLPDHLLPNLLEKGNKMGRIRPSILQVIGNRGRWLAQQNPSWQYASPEIDHWIGLLKAWETAVPPKRQALLRQIRTTHPERGRQILEHTWKSHNGMVRHQIIKILDINLSQADEPFLEAALDDRNHLVRRAAADLLAKLPEARLSQRMEQHVDGILSWAGWPSKITVRLPKQILPAMLRDGVPDIKEEDRVKLRSRLLTQIINRVPLAHWQAQWQKTPQEIVKAAKRSAWPRTLMSAFSTAAIRQKNSAWAEALIVVNEFNSFTGRLVPILTPSQCLALMQKAAKQSRQLKRPHPLHIFLQHWQQALSVPMGEFWLELFAEHLRKEKKQAPDPTVNNLFRRFGQKCAPELADTAVAKLTNISGLSSTWQKTVNHLCQTLQLRRDLLAEINKLGSTQDQPPEGFWR
ncbi:DUF5691 domain-containing protein [Candidatus Leptofilum sp.]|uniref:DUF5691 domain-containing protein n=1 Tax=Candidatus Leptofilum sp. TaxID=3241576 RepID=UPI003B5A510D